LARSLAAPGDALVSAVSDQPLIAAHAERHADSSVAVLVINTQPTTATRVSITIAGADLASSGVRFDYAPDGAASGSVVGPTPIEDVGARFELELGAYTATSVVIPTSN
jgi:hypothetical protein